MAVSRAIDQLGESGTDARTQSRRATADDRARSESNVRTGPVVCRVPEFIWSLHLRTAEEQPGRTGEVLCRHTGRAAIIKRRWKDSRTPVRKLRETMSTINLKQAQQAYELRKSWLGDGGVPVPPIQSQARADVCLKCPKNVEKPIQELLTEPVALIVRRQIELKNKLKLRVEGEKSLHVCDACNCVLKLKVHTPLKFILENTETNNLDPNCWILWEKECGELFDHQTPSFKYVYAPHPFTIKRDKKETP